MSATAAAPQPPPARQGGRGVASVARPGGHAYMTYALGEGVTNKEMKLQRLRGLYFETIHIQGDTSGCLKPPVDIDLSVVSLLIMLKHNFHINVNRRF